MSRETEKNFKEMHEFLANNANEDMTEEELNALVKEFMTQKNTAGVSLW